MRETVKRLLPPKVRLVAFAYKNFLVGDPIIRRLAELVDTQRTAVDIGANIGVYSYFLARLCPRVVAYEPNPLVAERLRQAAAGNVEVVRRGLSDQPGRATLSVPIIDGRQVHGLGRVAPNGDGQPATRFEVQLARLDDEPLTDVGFIKIDVEGHEESVMRGGERLIRRDRPVILVEIEQRHTPTPVADIFDRIESFGHEGFFLKSGKLRPVAEFDVARDQNITNLSRAGTAYINNFVFRPKQA